MNDADVQEILRRSPLFAAAPAGLVSAAAGCCEAVLLAAHQRLLTAGLANARLYVVLSGSLSVHASGGATFVRMGPSDCVGELSLLDNGPASADVVADQSTVLAAFDRDAIWSLVDASPEVARNLLRVLAVRDRRPAAGDAEPVRAERGGDQNPTVDSLTGLRNRRWMDDAFARQVERTSRAAQPSSILLIDIDHFTRLHAEHGVLVADAVLGRVANTLAAALRPQDLVARSGHAQFAVLLPGLDASASIAVAERLRRTVEAYRPEADEAELPRMTVSIGGTTRRPFELLPDLVKRAEAALERAKESGRNRSSE